ncbi:MAG: ATP-dependent 6-phosphofructokinase [Planctomycetia bacterium]|nr:ATP-dependent 6-phosphofructokinase [Planctomycetia bacterium]
MKIGVLCSGGDAPGMNPCIRAIVRAAGERGDEVVGIRHGYQGLIDGEFWQGDNIPKEISIRAVSGLTSKGGTILNSSRSTDFMTAEGQAKAIANLEKHKIDALIPIGGNGTLTGALSLTKLWNGQVIGIPGTIDNDLLGTDYTIGFMTAMQTAVEAIDKLRDTAGSHDMMFIVEVMGRHCGDLALQTAIAGGCEIVAVPEIPTSVDQIIASLNHFKKLGKRSMIMIVAEGDDLGGAVEMLNALKNAGSPYEMRVVVLGHVQRGGSPVPSDRILATKLGCFAVDALHQGETGKMAGEIAGKMVLTPFEDVIVDHRQVTPEMIELLQIVAS